MRNRSMAQRLFTWMVFTLLISRGYASDETPAIPSFEKEIRLILRVHCFQCHGEKGRNGLDLRDRSGLIQGGKSGPAVTPGSLRESRLWGFIATDKMPANDKKLSDAQKDMIRRWILAGAPQSAVEARQLTAQSKSKHKGSPVPRELSKLPGRIDQLIEEKLQKSKLKASPLTDDAEFHRRAYLDLIGRIPTYQQTVSFLASSSADKRSKLIDRLLASPEFGEHLGQIWERLLIPKTSPVYRRLPHQRFQKWLSEQFNKNRGWNQIVYDLLTASGSAPTPKPHKNVKGPVNVGVTYIVSHTMDGRPQPKLIAASSSRLFLGQSIECAQCHNHPVARWRRTDFWGVAAFFERTRYRGIRSGPSEVIEPGPGRNGREIVFNDPKAQRYYRVPAVRAEPVIAIESASGQLSDRLVRAKFLGGVEPKVESEKPLRPAFATWLTSQKNPFFAKAMVNRVWAQLMGRGFVEPVDDMAEDNPSSHPRLLEELASAFSASKFDLKALIRCICQSQTYQRTSAPTAQNKSDNNLFSHQSLKEMSGEVLLRSLYIASPALKDAHENKGSKKKKRAGIGAGDTFLAMFDQGESHPSEYSRGLQEALRLMNGEGQYFTGEAIKPLLKGTTTQEEAIERIYLQVLSRKPDTKESARMLRYLKANPKTDKNDPYGDIYWVLLNSSEFMFNH